MRLRLHQLAIVLSMQTLARAQVTWELRSPAQSPTARSGHALAFDEARGRAVLFGGVNGASQFGDTWEWDGSNWTIATPSQSPSSRDSAEMVYFNSIGESILFGGIAQGQPLSETWAWNGFTWTQKTPNVSPSPRFSPGMAYDSIRNVIVLFGGCAVGGSGKQSLNDTWEYDGNTWTQRSLSGGIPRNRAFAGMAFDPSRGKVVMWGGHDYTVCNCQLNDVWEWDGASWTQRFPSNSISTRYWPRTVFDAAIGRLVSFGGGNDSGPTFFDDTWESDGSNTWELRAPLIRPAPRSGHAMCYDVRKGVVLLFGGGTYSPNRAFNDTWEYRHLPGASVSTLGGGCPGSAGLTRLLPLYGTMPWLGSNLYTRLAPIPAGFANVPAALLGTQSAPLDLAPFGAPNCSLYLTPLLSIVLANAGGRADLTLAIPLNPALAGQSIVVQGLVTDGPANALGIAFADALSLTIGAK